MKKTAHGIYKNLLGDTIYNSQAAILVFFAGIAFNLSAAPAIINEEFGSSTFWAFLLYSIVDVLLTTVIFYFARKNGDALLKTTNSAAYKAVCFVAMLLLTLKGIFHFCYASSYLTHELFEGMEPSLIYLLFLLPVVYLGAKGITALSRTAEVFFPIIFIVLVLNIVFLQTKTDFARVLPVFSKEPRVLFGLFPRYGLWLGDMLPFLFIRIKDKRLPYLTIGVTGSWLFINLVVLLGVAIYGDALKTVSDLLIRIAGFNALSKDIGRTEWSNLICVLTTSILAMSFTYFGAIAACERVFDTGVPAKLAFPAGILFAVLLVPSAQTVTAFATGKFGYVMFCATVLIPLVALCLLVATRNKFPSISALLNEEYYVIKSERKTNSDEVGTLVGFKQEQTPHQVV